MPWKVIAQFQLPAPFSLLAILLLYQKHNKTSLANPSASATCEWSSTYSSQELHTLGGAFPADRPENYIDKLTYARIVMIGIC